MHLNHINNKSTQIPDLVSKGLRTEERQSETRRKRKLRKNNYVICTFFGDKLGGHPHLECSKYRGMITGHYIICTAWQKKKKFRLLSFIMSYIDAEVKSWGAFLLTRSP